MNTLSEYLREWQPFYATVASASATLTGLLFVSLSLNRGLLAGREGERPMRLAQRTFGDLLYVQMMSVLFLIPRQHPISFALAIIVLGCTRGISLVRLVRQVWVKTAERPPAYEVVREFALPLVAVAGLLMVAVSTFLGSGIAMYSLVAVVGALLTSAGWNAWLLLVQPGPTGEGGPSS